MKSIKERIEQRVSNARVDNVLHSTVANLLFRHRLNTLNLDAFYKVMSNKFEDSINEIHQNYT